MKPCPLSMPAIRVASVGTNVTVIETQGAYNVSSDATKKEKFHLVDVKKLRTSELSPSGFGTTSDMIRISSATMGHSAGFLRGLSYDGIGTIVRRQRFTQPIWRVS